MSEERESFQADGPDRWTRLNARIAELEAERDRLREALDYIAEEHDAGRHDGKPEPCPAHSDYFMWLKARAALTPKPGGTDA